MVEKIYVGVAGTSEEPSSRLVELASKFLEKLNVRDFKITFVLGGYWGFMKFFADKALERGYEVIFILPENPPAQPPNRENSIIIQTELGFRARSTVLCSTVDFLIVFGGRIGSMIEALLAYDFKRPVIIARTGYDTDKLCALGKYFDTRMLAPVYCVDTLEELLHAVEEILSKRRRAPISII